MTEGITYDPLGTVTVRFDDQTYKLRRPKFGQFRYFTRRYHEAIDALTSELQDLTTQLEAIAEEDKPELRARVAELSRRPLHEVLTPILADMFNQVGDALPEDADDWPAWLAADVQLLPEILKHWRSVPKASGPAQEGNGSG